MLPWRVSRCERRDNTSTRRREKSGAWMEPTRTLLSPSFILHIRGALSPSFIHSDREDKGICSFSRASSYSVTQVSGITGGVCRDGEGFGP